MSNKYKGYLISTNSQQKSNGIWQSQLRLFEGNRVLYAQECGFNFPDERWATAAAISLARQIVDSLIDER